MDINQLLEKLEDTRRELDKAMADARKATEDALKELKALSHE